jgi:hypothetical protein
VDTGGGGGKGVGLDGWAPHALWQHLSESVSEYDGVMVVVVVIILL